MTLRSILATILFVVYFVVITALFYQEKVKISEFITLLGIIPIVIAIFQEQIKRWWFAPNLRIDFKLEAPFCSKTPFFYGEPNKPPAIATEAYYFRFGVVNDGKSQATRCEAFICELKWLNGSKWYDVDYFQQVNLKWDTGKTDTAYMDLNPSPLRLLGIIGTIIRDVPEGQSNQQFNFAYLYSIGGYQPQFLSPDKTYKFRIVVVSENAEYKSKEFKFHWTGRWGTSPDEMFKEVQLEVL